MTSWSLGFSRSAFTGLSARGLWALLGGLALAGCGQDRERPPGIGAGCVGACVGRGGGNGGGGGTGGGTSGDAGLGTLTGQVAILNDMLTATMAFEGLARVTAEGPDSSFVEATTDGEGRFEVTGVTLEPGWVGVQALGAPDLLPTLQPMDVSQLTDQTLLLVRGSTLDLWVASAQTITMPLVTHGQVLLHVVDAETQSPKAGVSVRQSAGAELVLYDDGPSLSANLEATSVRGYVALVNLAARAYPGMLVPITLDDGAQVVSVELRVAEGAVTVLDVAM